MHLPLAVVAFAKPHRANNEITRIKGIKTSFKTTGAFFDVFIKF